MTALQLNQELIYITNIDKEAAFLKIWGQTDKEMPIAVEKALGPLNPIFDQGNYTPSADQLYNGMLVCAKFKDGMYYR